MNDQLGSYFASIDHIPVMRWEECRVHLESYRRLRAEINQSNRCLASKRWPHRYSYHLARIEHDHYTMEGVRNKIVQGNLRLAVSRALKFAGKGVDINDLVSEANIGLMRAVNMYDSTYKCRYSTYAATIIKNMMFCEIGDQHIMMSRGSAYRVRILKEARNSIIAMGIRKPTDKDLVDFLNEHGQPSNRGKWTLRNIEGMRAQEKRTHMTFLDHDECFIDPSYVMPEYISDQFDPVRKILDAMPPSRDKSIVEARFGLNGEDPMTLKQVGTIYGITRERARQIEQRIIGRIRKALTGDHGPMSSTNGSKRPNIN